ncbi:unnamed protein product [Gordionus sp. m RMFG-2023]
MRRSGRESGSHQPAVKRRRYFRCSRIGMDSGSARRDVWVQGPMSDERVAVEVPESAPIWASDEGEGNHINWRQEEALGGNYGVREDSGTGRRSSGETATTEDSAITRMTSPEE